MPSLPALSLMHFCGTVRDTVLATTGRQLAVTWHGILSGGPSRDTYRLCFVVALPSGARRVRAVKARSGFDTGPNVNEKRARSRRGPTT
jgi:hypothetical protein